jgi:hypothetical protein
VIHAFRDTDPAVGAWMAGPSPAMTIKRWFQHVVEIRAAPLSAFFSHMWNADLASHTGGMTDTGLRLGFKFYRRSRIPIAGFDRRKQRFADDRPPPTCGPQPEDSAA